MRLFRSPMFLLIATVLLVGCVPPAPTEFPTAEPEEQLEAPTLAPTETAVLPPAPEEEPPIPSSAVFEDEINDPIDCRSGEPVDQEMAGYMDIHRIRLEAGEGSASWVWEVAPGSDLPALFAASPLAGGVGFADASRPTPEDPNWYFNNVANTGFGFIWNRDTKMLDGYDSVFTVDGWTTVEGFTTSVVVAGNEIRVTLPWEQIPAGAAWYGSTTNGVVCDQIGLVDDLPTLDGPQAGSSGEIY
jgi:hypothetical protein